MSRFFWGMIATAALQFTLGAALLTFPFLLGPHAWPMAPYAILAWLSAGQCVWFAVREYRWNKEYA